MATIRINSLECDFPSLTIDQLANYMADTRIQFLPISTTYVAWRAKTHDFNVFLHAFISNLESIGEVTQLRFFECDLEPSGSRIGRSIMVCTCMGALAEELLLKFLRNYCGTDYVLMRPWWVADGLKVKGGRR